MTARRVYLMADTGEGPKVAAKLYPGNWPGQGPISGGYSNAVRIASAKASARQWWLVEAESADAARRIISTGYRWCAVTHVNDDGNATQGRILDSGGAA